jgi:hypothetical protein
MAQRTFGRRGPSIFSGTPTIVIQHDGEMANHLWIFAFGYIVKWILEDDYNMTPSVVVRRHSNRKWVKARKSMMCFTKIRAMDFSKVTLRNLKIVGSNNASGLAAINLFARLRYHFVKL